MMLLASTNARTEILGFTFPASWYASALGAFEVALAPVVAAVWAKMGPASRTPPTRSPSG